MAVHVDGCGAAGHRWPLLRSRRRRRSRHLWRRLAKPFRGRLPAYFGKVVSDKQRAEIYAIQARYNEQLEKLQEQLETLTAKRDTEVEEVLTDEQRAEIAKLKQARSSRRSSTSSASGGADTK